MQKQVPAVLKTTHAATDTVDDYRAAYGYLGPALYSAVVKLRHSASGTGSQSSSTTAVVSDLSSRSAAALPFFQVTSAPSL